MGILTQALGLILSLSILVFFHELGHFFFARLFKTRVEKFYLFFNPYFSIIRAKKINGKWNFSFLSKKSPEAWNEHPDKTEWGLGWLPLGGYCSIAGMIDETKSADNLASEPQPWEYRSKKTWQRFFIITGGVLVNFVMALLIYAMILFTWGEEYIPVKNAKNGFQFSETAIQNGFQNGDKILKIEGQAPETIGDINTKILIDNVKTVTVERKGQVQDIQIPADLGKKIIGSGDKMFCDILYPFVIQNTEKGSAAEKMGLQANDSLISVNGVLTPSVYDLQKQIQDHTNKQITLEYVRAGISYKIPIQVSENGRLGISAKPDYSFFDTKKIEYGFFESFPKGIAKGVKTLVMYVKQFKLVFTKAGASQVGGFGAIGGMFPKAWSWAHFWSNTALISIILAFMNILPIPALDGGHMLFILVEMVTGRKPSDKFLERAQMVGFFLLIGLLVYANGMDVMRLIKSFFH